MTRARPGAGPRRRCLPRGMVQGPLHRDARGASRGFERGDSERDYRARKPG